jgi:hypothetical protein
LNLTFHSFRRNQPFSRSESCDSAKRLLAQGFEGWIWRALLHQGLLRRLLLEWKKILHLTHHGMLSLAILISDNLQKNSGWRVLRAISRSLVIIIHQVKSYSTFEDKGRSVHSTSVLYIAFMAKT